MFLQPAIIAVALSLIAAATPVDPQNNGIVVPLQKRSSLTTEDGVFNYQAALKSMQRTHNKHRQNLINLERNSGRQAFSKVSSHA